jgi:hypothetical protein
MLGWFWDLHTRQLLDLDPPYQRRSVWNQEYRDFFIDTVLRGHPCPAIFLYEDISPDGTLRYSVVDGRQRLSTLFDFASNEFPVSEKYGPPNLRGKYFKELSDDLKRAFWGYQFSVEYVPSSNEHMISDIFDRINRNVARLTPQELRHARLSGEFISSAEELAEWMLKQMPPNFPNLASRSIRQMKDVELVGQLLLLVENGPRSYSQYDLDQAFSERDEVWEAGPNTKAHFQEVIKMLRALLEDGDTANALVRSRLRNQADFYSLFGALCEQPFGEEDLEVIRLRLKDFVDTVDDVDRRLADEKAKSYYSDARSASNDAGPRRRRIDIIKDVLRGAWREDERPSETASTVQ